MSRRDDLSQDGRAMLKMVFDAKAPEFRRDVLIGNATAFTVTVAVALTSVVEYVSNYSGTPNITVNAPLANGATQLSFLAFFFGTGLTLSIIGKYFPPFVAFTLFLIAETARLAAGRVRGARVANILRSICGYFEKTFESTYYLIWYFSSGIFLFGFFYSLSALWNFVEFFGKLLKGA